MILHIDMDAFYASVEERENPGLKGLPLIVGGRPEVRGVVAAANYESRKYGIHSAMPTSTAIRKCPDLLIIKPRGELYNKVSRQIRQIFNRYTPIIEPLSLDEAFLDPQGSEKLYGDAGHIGRKIKADILNELELIASVGVAPNKFVAKLASDQDKPDGFTVIKQDQVQSFLDPLPVNRIWGVGKAASQKLAQHRIATVSDIRKQDPEFLNDLFGQYGEQLWKLAHGIDNRVVTPDSEVKSISQETTFDQDICDYHSIESTTLYLTESVGYRLREAGLKGRTITVKIRFGDFRTITRSKSLNVQTNLTDAIWKVAQSLIKQVLSGEKFAIRLIGLGVSNFNQNVSIQTDLFGINSIEQRTEGNQVIDQLSDNIRKKFGKESIKRGKSLG